LKFAGNSDGTFRISNFKQHKGRRGSSAHYRLTTLKNPHFSPEEISSNRSGCRRIHINSTEVGQKLIT
jgi:hypothetical protein